MLDARFTSHPLRLAQYLGSFLGAIRSFRKTIATVKPDLLHANSVRAGIVATLATTGTRTMVLWHIHDDLPAHPISNAIRRLAFRSKRSRFVAVSHATARTFAGGLPFAYRLQVLHNFVDTARFPPKTMLLDVEAQAFRDELGLPPDAFLAVTVGMLNHRKGQLPLLDAWNLAQRNLAEFGSATSPAHLAIVGAPLFNNDHLYEQQLRAKTTALGLDATVHFTGARSDIPAVLRAANVLVLNAKVEPFGLVLLEAMSSRTAVIASEVGGIPEIVSNDLTGILVPSPLLGNEQQLAHQLVRAYWSPGTLFQLADAAIADVLPQFTIPVFAANLEALYTSLNLSETSA